MRLLKRCNKRILVTENLHNHDIPPYTILSHTWGDPSDEAHLKDVIEGTACTKAGYKKIDFCCEQTERDGLQHFWVDSCCIDRSSSYDVQEAIISMFRWYKNAAKCYVYLSDVSTSDPKSRWKWEQAFRGSRWFTRGWTLQELLAPQTVEFFSREGSLLGNKKDLEGLIQEITKIPLRALQGIPMSQFGVDERFSWAEHRHTLIEADEAYCLVGIFEIYMPLIPGEERHHAMRRLKKEVYEASNEYSWKTPFNRSRDGAVPSSSELKQNWMEPAKSQGEPATSSRTPVHGLAALHTLNGHADDVWTVAFSPDGKMLASGSTGKMIKLWDSQSGVSLQTLRNHTRGVLAIVFSPDGKELASGSFDGTIRHWDSQSGALLKTLVGHMDSVRSVAFSPDGKKLISGSVDRTIKLWESQSGRLLQSLYGHIGSVVTVAFSPDGKRLVSGSNDNTIKLWDSQSGVLLQTLQGHTGSVFVVAFSPDGKRLVSGSADETIKLWDSQLGVLKTLHGHTGSVIAVAFSPDGKELASGSMDKTMKLWDSQSGELLQTLSAFMRAVKAVTYLPSGKILACGPFGCTVKLWVTMNMLNSTDHHLEVSSQRLISDWD